MRSPEQRISHPGSGFWSSHGHNKPLAVANNFRLQRQGLATLEAPWMLPSAPWSAGCSPDPVYNHSPPSEMETITTVSPPGEPHWSFEGPCLDLPRSDADMPGRELVRLPRCSLKPLKEPEAPPFVLGRHPSLTVPQSLHHSQVLFSSGFIHVFFCPGSNRFT